MTDPLNDDEIAHVIRFAPLVSIKLIIRDAESNVLVARRTNEPAKDFYFVPGGCIRKDERIENAFARILERETGCRAEVVDAQFLGVFQHFYPTKPTWEFPRLCRGGSKSLTYPAVDAPAP
jgi:colanic acid biosynthesis protein WcaH